MQQLSETSLTMKTALEGGGEGFDALGEKAAAARGEVQRTEQAIRRLNAADALQNLRDTDHAYSKAVREAQGQQEKTSHYGEFSDAYNQYMEAHPSGYYKQGYFEDILTMNNISMEQFKTLAPVERVLFRQELVLAILEVIAKHFKVDSLGRDIAEDLDYCRSFVDDFDPFSYFAELEGIAVEDDFEGPSPEEMEELSEIEKKWAEKYPPKKSQE